MQLNTVTPTGYAFGDTLYVERLPIDSISSCEAAQHNSLEAHGWNDVSCPGPNNGRDRHGPPPAELLIAHALPSRGMLLQTALHVSRPAVCLSIWFLPVLGGGRAL